MKKQKESALSNTKIAIVFFVFLAFIVGISLFFKLVTIMMDSEFDNSKRFTLSIANGKNIELLSLSPNSKGIAVFKFTDRISPLEAGRLLEVPIDGFIVKDSVDLNGKINSLFINLILNYNRLETNLTIIDLLRIALSSWNIPDSAINVRMVKSDETDFNKIVGRLVNDELIEKDNKTIQIINATTVGGLGNRLARLITNIGGNVIIVATGNIPSKTSSISYIDKKTYTVEKLQKILGYDLIEGGDSAISDITITIGEDKIGSAPF